MSLIALVGCTEQHAIISTHLNSEQPPINTLALPDLAKICLLLPVKTTSPPPAGSSPTPGILKRDWLQKHRTKIPSVVVALFSYLHVAGDPAQWLQVCSDVDQLKTLTRPRNIRLVVVVHSSNDEMSEDRLLALRKRAEVDAKFLLLFNPDDASDLQQSLKRLGNAFAESATSYYRDEGRRIKTRIEKRTFNSVDLHVRYCFKVAVYAEFRSDWVEALRFYEDAYHALREMVATLTRLPGIQRLIEIKTVAEQLHLKISTLLLHGGKLTEAVKWFRQHYASYRKLVGSPENIFLHWEWVSRQFLVFAELLETSSATVQNIPSLASGPSERPLTEWEFYPAYYYQLAANYLKEKRGALELALSISENWNEIDSNEESVVPSNYVGQFARLLEQGDAIAMQPLTDEEYTRYAIAEGKRFQDSFEIIALLKKSHESYGNLKVRRVASLCAFQIAREYYSLDDFSNAKPLFDGIANLYRQEGWVTVLWEVLGYLRECSRRLGEMKDFTEYSLEMAALPVSSGIDTQHFRARERGPGGPASHTHRETIHKEVFALVNGEVNLAPTEGNHNLKVTGDNPLLLEIDQVSPLRSVLLASVTFHEQIIKPGVPSSITLSLLSQLPLGIEIDHLEVQFNQPECNFVIKNAQRSTSDAVLSEQQGCRVESVPSLALLTNKWLRLTYDVKSEQSGKLECISIIAKMGTHFTICCRAESPASMDGLPVWKFEDRVETFPIKDPTLAFSGQKAAQVEEPDPQVDLTVDALGPALVGESFMVPVTITARDHALHFGELKINLVDARGGGLFSPRESEPFSLDSHHVELISIIGPGSNVDKIQQSFGLVSVPSLEVGKSWSCKLEIKWHRAKPIMLFVSLGYSLNEHDSTAQKTNIHKSLQIEGKIAVQISHRFMAPFRRDSLLLSRINPAPDSDHLESLPLNETSVLLVSAKNCSDVPLQLFSISIEADDDNTQRSGSVEIRGEDLSSSAVVVPGEEFKKVFTVNPKLNSSKLELGSVHLKWGRQSGNVDQSGSWVSTKHKLSDVNVESSPLVVSLDCPPYAVLGEPLTYSVKVQNQTELLQEVKFSLADAQGFVLSGSHNNTALVLPKSEHILCYKIVPLASGLQQLPRVSLTAVRYSAAFRPSTTASAVFVFPSKPHFKTGNSNATQKQTELDPELVAAD